MRRPPTRRRCVVIREAYLQALRNYVRAGKEAALEIRRGAA